MTMIEPCLATRSGRARFRGRTNHRAGASAEDQVASRYARAGMDVRERRCRTPYGELDLVCQTGGTVIFVEVKQRRRGRLTADPVGLRQWRRLAAAATHYLALHATPATACRFDVAIVAGDGAIEVFENARTFEDLTEW